MRKKTTLQSAFTLIELSIVIVIIGLIIGGITVGQSMSENAKIQNVIAEKEGVVAAIKQFEDKYKGLPGDLYNATDFWPAASACGNGTSSPALPDSDVCNGNGNGQIAGVTSDLPESHWAWRQLALAGFIDGSYSGFAGGLGSQLVEPGEVVPITDYQDNTGWHIYYFGRQASTSFYDGQYGHILYLGTAAIGAPGVSVVNGVSQGWAQGDMEGEHIISIDDKVDDGSPETGNIRSAKEGSDFAGDCVVSDAYVLDATDCVPIFLTGIN